MERFREEQIILNAMRRVNLDAFWIREISTTSNTLINAKKMLKTSGNVGLKVSFVLWVRMSKWDYCG